MMAAYSMVAIGREHASLLLCLVQVGISANLVRSQESFCIELQVVIEAFQH